MSPSSARCRLTCRLAILAVAGRGLTWPRIWGRWLPVRLPAISLAMLMFECPGPAALPDYQACHGFKRFEPPTTMTTTRRTQERRA